MDTNSANGRVAVKLIGSAIREMREARGLTLEKLASNAHISYQYLSGIETGKENFSISILEKIARALEVPLPALVTAAYGRQARPEKVEDARGLFVKEAKAALVK